MNAQFKGLMSQQGKRKDAERVDCLLAAQGLGEDGCFAGTCQGWAGLLRFLPGVTQVLPDSQSYGCSNIITGCPDRRRAEEPDAELIAGRFLPIQNMNTLKVLLVDDNLGFLQSAADFVSRHPVMEIAGLAHSGREALRMVSEVCPDLVIMDLSMPEMNGLEATRRIKALASPPQVVIVTLYDGPEFCSSAQAAGADQFISKAEFVDSLMPLVFRLFPRLQSELTHECA
ncbi:MAG: chemotaxis protein CheY [Pedosphaera sp.]|nr:chemotaxis protein CheY [Pedosphaera sp.]